jgi:hypothetical protein
VNLVRRPGLALALALLSLLGAGAAQAQVRVVRHSDGRVAYIRDEQDRVFKPNGGIGWPPKGADPVLWYAYDPYILANCATEGVDPVLAKAVIWQESRVHWRATSRTKAKGLMQLMPKTAVRFGLNGDAYEPIGNIKAGIKYLAYLQTYYAGNMIKIVAAYNAGEGNVDKHGGIPPFKETRKYVPSVLWTWDWIQRS